MLWIRSMLSKWISCMASHHKERDQQADPTWSKKLQERSQALWNQPRFLGSNRLRQTSVETSQRQSNYRGKPGTKLSNLPQSSPAGSAAEIATQKLNFWVTTTNSAPVTCTYIHSYIETYIETREVMIIYID